MSLNLNKALNSFSGFRGAAMPTDPTNQEEFKAIFNSKKNLHNLYPDLGGIKHFDLERKQLLYGRIDRQGNAIYLDSAANLTEIYTGGGKTELARIAKL